MMGNTVRSLQRLFSFPQPDRLLLVKTAILLLLIKLGLAILPFRRVRAVLDWAVGVAPPPGRSDCAELNRIIWGATVMGNALLADRACLAQALAVQLLYRRRGRPAELHIGVRRERGGAMKAHAWVTSHGRIVIGGAQSPLTYTPFPSLGQ